MCNSCNTFSSGVFVEEVLVRGGVHVDDDWGVVLSSVICMDSSDSESDQNKSPKETSLKN